MNVVTILRQVCERNNGTFQIEKEYVKQLNGTIYPVVYYCLTIPYKETSIEIICEYGNSDVATIDIKLLPRNPIDAFQVTTIDHILKLFLFRENNWTVKSKSKYLKTAIKALIHKSKLIDLLRETALEPEVSGQMKGGCYNICTVFSLNFPMEAERMHIIIQFHKGLIDVLLSRNSYY